MATAPVKSQPLHNFDLPHLRWAHKNHHSPHSNNTHHRFRRRDSPDLHHQGGNNNITSLSASNAAESDPDRDDTCGQASKPSSRTPRKPFSFSFCSSQQNHQQKDAAAAGLEKEKEKDDGFEEGESDAKPWNLRPRKLVTFPTTSFKKGERMSDETVLYQKNDNSGAGYGHSKSSRLRGPVVEGSGPGMGHGSSYGSERQRKVVEEKRKLWISLSREEIEEDVYALTGSRPARRPKKRPKIVQKQLDNVFPGLYLVGMTVDAYRVHDSLR